MESARIDLPHGVAGCSHAVLARAVIRLVGPGGAGKSTAGALLVARLGCPFLDLDREFERRCGGIDEFIAAHGYEAYARANVEVYLGIEHQDAVLALSSGFMVYPPSVHLAYAAAVEAIARDPATFVLLPSLELEACVAETVRRQMARPLTRRDAAREEAVIRARFGRYLAFPARKVETMRPAPEVAAAIAALLARDARRVDDPFRE